MTPFKMRETVLVVMTVAAVLCDARKVRVKPAASSEEVTAASHPPRQVLFYAEEPQQQLEEDEQPVVIARQPHYGRAVASAAPRPRTEPPNKSPPVQTIRNYNKINDDGSFTFGYEAADGSFKEETRGTDCVVRGKYGYIDPDGNKREFTYVSGNPCDPNAISQEEEDAAKDKSNEDENVPANIPRRPTFVVRPHAKTRPATTLFSQSFNNVDDSVARDQEPNPQLIEIRPTLRPSYLQSTPREEEESSSQILRSTTRPVARVTYPSSTRFATRQSTENQPATTYRPQLVQLAVTPTPTPAAAVPPKATRGPYVSSPATSAAPPQSVYFDEQFKKFQLESNAIPSSAGPTKAGGAASNPIYSTELVYDPTSGQYNTIVYQQVPKFSAEAAAAGIAPPSSRYPFVPSSQLPLTSVTSPRLLLGGSTTPAPPVFQQQYIQQQQQAALVQQSQQLYNEQLKRQHQQRQYAVSQAISPNAYVKQSHRFPSPSSLVQRYPPDTKPLAQLQEPYQQPPPPFYYYNPTAVPDQRANVANGQIEAFLRGHNLQF